jgi:hypothetical protein
MAVEGIAVQARLLVDVLAPQLGPVDLTECYVKLAAETERVQAGDLAGLEAMLAAQSITLNALFGSYTRRSQINTGNLEVSDTLMRMALRAQAQCRATIETLAAIKNPPVVFAKQANISSGPQQVNNHAPAEEISIPPNRLLEAHERVDDFTALATGRRDSELAAVGTLDGAADGGRQGAMRHERLPGRRTPGRPTQRARVS